jgi:zinc transport system substrate-binding protein
MMHRLHSGFLLIVLLLAAVPAMAAEKLVIYTVNYPLQYFAQRIGGQHVDVHFPAPKDIDPAFWKPDAKTVAEYQQADLILLNGANYAKWVNQVTLPRQRMVDTSRSYRDQLIKVSAGATHSHGPGGDHSHSGTAFTTWLDPQQASLQAKAIRDALIAKRPDLKGEFEQNYQALHAQLMEIDNRIKQIVAKQPRQPLLASHPVYQYLARRYDLNLESVLWEPQVMPSDRQWQALRELLSEHPARRMIWEGQPDPEIVEQLKQLAVHSTVFDPCANVPAQGDYLEVMHQNVRNLEIIFPEMSIM